MIVVDAGGIGLEPRVMLAGLTPSPAVRMPPAAVLAPNVSARAVPAAPVELKMPPFCPRTTVLPAPTFTVCTAVDDVTPSPNISVLMLTVVLGEAGAKEIAVVFAGMRTFVVGPSTMPLAGVTLV